MPTDPGPCRWDFPDPAEATPGEDVVAFGADLEPGTLIQAYASGLFPMHFDGGELAWWSPDPRGILPLDRMRVTRSLRMSARKFTVTFDRTFAEVIDGCADLRRPHCWITEEVKQAYLRIHELGWAHSVEVWLGDSLVGGLYGIEVGGVFAGESMFHVERDASKVALLALVERLRACGGERLLDVQWRTDHLASLGVIEVPRVDYLQMLKAAIRVRPCLGAR